MLNQEGDANNDIDRAVDSSFRKTAVKSRNSRD